MSPSQTSSKTTVAKKPRKTPASSSAKRRASKKSATGSGHLIYGVVPYKSAKNEEYMSDGQLAHFRTILENWKNELMEEVDRTLDHMREEVGNVPDASDRASNESEFGLELRTRDRERKLIHKIDSALERISDCSYGYCKVSGEEIGLARLEARPIATMCVEVQERYELSERHYSDRGVDRPPLSKG